MRIEVARLRPLVAAALLCFAPRLTMAQLPSQSQIQQALSNPAMAGLIKSKIEQSGMTPDQIRSRLQAAGYSPTLLDSYLNGTPDTTATGTDVLGAVKFLGLVDSTEAAALQAGRSSMAVPPPAPQNNLPVGPASPTTPATTAASTEPKIFGLDVFRRSTSQFEPDVAGPVDANYRLGPRDVLALILTGAIDQSYTLEVTREGFIVVPQVGQIYVANLTLAQASDIVYERLRRVYSNVGRGAGSATQFYLTVAKLRTNQVFVVGDAMAPGSYQVSSAGTMLTALYAAGGPSDNGSLRGIELRRNGQVVSTLDVYDYLTKGDASRDARMETGDVLFVPVHGPRVEIQGEVIRPAIYELKTGETLADLIRMAGGFTAQAGRSRVLVHRIVPATQRTAGGRDRTVLDVASDAFATGYGPAFPLEAGDAVEVFGIPERVRNEVAVSGDVWTPGTQGYTPGMRLSDAIKRAGGVRPDVKDVLVSRLQSDQTRRQLRAAFVDTLGTLAQDMALQEDDSVIVFGTSDFRPARYVAITGAVNNGGKFPWREGMTMRDLVHLAGGLADGAYLVQAEVARLPEDRSGGALATTVTVPLDSTYLLERGLDGRYHGPPGIEAATGKAPEVVLQPYDNVLILRQPDWQLDRTVVLSGDVKFPGAYTLTSKTERLSDVVKRAGGLMPTAYALGAIFSRANSQTGRIGVDLDAALKRPGSRDDFVLLDGDSLFVPRYKPTVKIEGSVNSPITVAYVPGQKLSGYVDAAGGYTYNADRGRAYVRQPTGIVDPFRKRWLFIPDHDPVVEAGGTVVVPAKDPNDKKDWTAIAGSVAQIIVGAVGVVAIVLRK